MSAWKPSFVGIARPEEEAGVVEADAVDRREVRGVAGGEVDQVHVVQPAFRVESELLVLLLPPAVLGALPAAADDRQPPVRRPARELRPGVRLAAELLGESRRPVPSVPTTAARMVATLACRPPGRSVRSSV